MRQTLMFAAMAAFMVAGVMWGAGWPTARASTVAVQLGNLYFCSPEFQNGVCETTVTEGDTVVWNNVEGFHTVTQCDASFAVCAPAGGFDSGQLTAGNSFSHTFDTPGVFAYHCSFHPAQMKGRITVQAAATATPTATPTGAPTASPAGTGAAPTATVAPAAVPGTGGEPGGGPSTAPWAGLALLAGAALLTGAAAMWRGARKERLQG